LPKPHCLTEDTVFDVPRPKMRCQRKSVRARSDNYNVGRRFHAINYPLASLDVGQKGRIAEISDR